MASGVETAAGLVAQRALRPFRTDQNNVRTTTDELRLVLNYNVKLY